MDDQLLKKELERDEGVRRNPYKDTLGIPTVGIGYNLSAHKLPEGMTYPLSNDDIDKLYSITINEFFDKLDKRLPWWRDLDEVRQRVIANMAFNMGINGLLSFKNTLAFVKSGDYLNASINMKLSKWYKQVGERAWRLRRAMRTGVMPTRMIEDDD